MARLEEVREELYSKKPGQSSRPKQEGLAAPKYEAKVERVWESSRLTSSSLLERAYLAKWRSRSMRPRTFVIIGVLALAGIAAFAGYTVFFSRTPVELEILGSNKVTAGEPSSLIIHISNKSSAGLKEGSLTLTLPEGASTDEEDSPAIGPLRKKIEIPDIPAGGEFQRELRVKFLGSMGRSERVSGLFLYRPENISSTLTRSAELSVTIVKVPVVIAVDVPDKISSGQDISMTIGIDAEAASPLAPMTLGIDFPDGFEFKSSDPAPAFRNPNLWPLGSIETGTSTKIVLRGAIKGEPQEVKAFRIRLGRYNESSRSWLILTEAAPAPIIASPFLLARSTLEGMRSGALSPGSRVEGSVFFKNNLPDRIQNIVIALSFPEQFVELGTIAVEKGFYDVTRRAIVWDPGSNQRLGALDPGEEGTLAFSFALKSVLPLRNFSDKNFIFDVTTSINSSSPPPEYRGVSLEYRDSVKFKIESSLAISARAAYYDSPSPNTGPLPPQVRKATTYTVFLQLGSGANDLRDVEIRAGLPGGVEFADVLGTDAGQIAFNPASREVVWKVGQLKAATGILRSHLSAIFKVSLTPAENQANTSPPILKDIAALGRDTFTDTELQTGADNLTTELRNDSRSVFGEWRVVP